MTTIVTLFYGYWLVGAVFGLYFVIWGAARLDHDAEAMTWQMRLILLPGSVALWPLLLGKLLDLSKTKVKP
jgi:hypothetical protein